jgi:RNA polymerase sigma-70 factor, ECF subfamily
LTSTISHNTEHLIDQARGGDPLALGPLLASYSDQLRRLANRQLDDKLRGRVSPSDIVQETLLQATRDIANFRGISDAEFGSWLRRILARKISKSIERHLLAEKRDIRRETFLGHGLQGKLSDLTGHHEHRAVADPRPGPATEVVRSERGEHLAATMSTLPPAYREIIELRNVQGLPFDEIARRLNRTSGAARMLWLRAIDQLRRQMCSQD